MRSTYRVSFKNDWTLILANRLRLITLITTGVFVVPIIEMSIVEIDRFLPKLLI